MGPLMSSGFGRDGSRPDHSHRFGPGRTRFSVQPCEHAMCAGGTVALLAWSRRPTIPVAATRRTLSGASSTSCSAKAEPRRSEGSLPSGTDHRATPLYSVGPRGPDHDAVMRIGGEAPGRRAHSRKRCQHHGLLRVTATSDRHRTLTMFCSSASESLSFLSLLPHAARNTTPAGTSPVVARRHKAISNLRARATIIVLRFLPPSVRVRYHWANALSF